MSLVASLALALSGAALPHCSWDKPGVNPFMGDLVAAVDRYKDIPAATRAKLKARMQERRYDEIVDIRRDSITGRGEYDADIRGMHFGDGQVCTTVSRAKWSPQSLERGLVYCEDGQCLLVPTVCRNLSRITRRSAPSSAPATSQSLASATREGEDTSPLMFEAPGAGAPGAGSAGPAADAGSFASTAGLPTSTISSVSPGLSGNAVAPSGGLGLVTLPQGVTPAVPEPQTWALMALGLTAVAWAARRRQPQA
jgi:hypothetical protein